MSDQAVRHLQQRRADGALCLHEALRYRTLGWSVLSVCPPDHMGVGKSHAEHCSSPGKAPWGTWKEFQDRLPTEDELRRKWRDNPTLNVGVALGPVSGLIRVDVDGPAGEARLSQLAAGLLPPTLEFTSGRKNGGRGLLFAVPAGASLRTTVDRPDQPKQELRFQARGAQTVLPPSRHPEGCLYAWVDGRSPWDIEAAPAPPWLLAQLQVGPRSGKVDRAQTLPDGEKLYIGARNTVLTSMAGTMRHRGFCAEAIRAALLVEDEVRCDPPLGEAAIASIANSVGRYPTGSSCLLRLRPASVTVELEV